MCNRADDPTQHDVPATGVPADLGSFLADHPEYVHPRPDAEPDPWLVAFFEYEYCAECGGDAQHHTAIPFLGGLFARCDYPPDAEGNYHPVIAAFRALEDKR